MSTTLSHAVPQSDTFFGRVMGYFAYAVGLTAVGTFYAPFFLAGKPAWIMYALFAVALGLTFSAQWWMQKRPMNMVIFSALAVIMGITVYPLLSLAGAVGGIGLIAQALFASTAMFVAAGIIGATTKKDLSGMGKFLMLAIIGLIIVSVLQIFFHSTMMEFVISGVGIILFSAWTAYDFQQIQHYPDNMAMEAGFSLYLNFFNLFTSVLRFMLAFMGDD